MGPFGQDQVIGMLSGGLVASTDLAWCQGVADWQPLHTLLGLPPPPPVVAASSVTTASTVSTTPPSTAAQPTSPTGVGGWLTFFCVGLTILGPLVVLGSIANTWSEAKPAFVSFPAIKAAIIWESAGSIVLLIYGFIVGCIVWSGSPQGRTIARRYLLIRFFGFVGIEVFALFLLRDIPASAFSEVVLQMVIAIAQNAIAFLIWWFYFKKSKRVSNTYGEG